MSQRFGNVGTSASFQADSVTGEQVEQKSTNGAAHVTDGALASIVISAGGYTYVAEAAPGSSETAAVWRCCRIAPSGSTTWADGNGYFDNTPGVAGASLSGLTYS